MDAERERYELELQRGREILDTVGNSTPSFLVVVRDDGRFSVFEPLNASSQRALGYGDDDVSGQDFVELLIAPEDAADARALIAGAVPGAAPVEIASSWVTRSGERRLVAWSVTHLAHHDDGVSRSLLVSGSDVTERKRQEDELRASRARLVETADTERRRLERNLHDGAQQRLVTLSLNLSMLESRLGGDTEAARELAEVRDELAQALAELRDLARGIHPGVLTGHGLGPALDALADRVTVPVAIRHSLDERLPEPVEVAAYYVVSESLANVEKYAHASRVRIEVGRREGHAFVEVSDDGVGGADAGGGTGLRGLADRVEALGGRLEIESETGAGTVVRALIPT